MTAAAPLAARQLAAEGRVAEALVLLETAAALGDGGALLMLGAWSFEGRVVPRNLAAARSFYGRAAHAGSSHAPAVYLAMLANAIGGARDWGRALAELAELAANDPRLRRDLALLEAMTIDADGNPEAVPSIELLSESPWIAIAQGFATRAECDCLITLAKPLLQPSRVVDPRTGQSSLHPIRTSDSAVIPAFIEPLPVHAIHRRIAAVTATLVEQGEPLHILRYAPGQQYRLHGDYLPPGSNQRIVTAILYLNEDYEGGATVFPDAGIEVRAHAGDLLIFRNVDGEGRPDVRSRHAGLPVEAGIKMIATRWIREAPVA